MPRTVRDYTVACICPMGVELAPVQAMLDEEHPPIHVRRDYNTYTLGSIGEHNVVVAILPEIGFNAASKVALEVMEDFPAIRFGLLVGLGGGVPDDNEEDDGYDIRLGDVVVSKPVKEHAGVVQYNLEKYFTHGTVEKTGALQKPPSVLLSTVEILAAKHRRLGSRIPDYLAKMIHRFPNMAEEYTMPDPEHDQLFHSSYPHAGGRTCRTCDRQWIVKREARRNNKPRFHYGTIASANIVIRDAALRDELRKKMGVKCVEMEAAGLMESFPCLVVRGICDYADSHKNKRWQPYAAATAAGYVKELLSEIIPMQVMDMAAAIDIVRAADGSHNFGLGMHLYNTPDIGDELFVGRNMEVDQLRTRLSPETIRKSRKVAVLGGMGGVGKTQVAIAYAKRHNTNYTSIFWLDATSELTLQADIRNVMNWIVYQGSNKFDDRAGDDVEYRKKFMAWFSQAQNTQWLLIFDNYDDPHAYSIQSYYPTAAQGSIIVTTRRPNRDMGDVIHVSPMAIDGDAIDVLRKTCCRPFDYNDQHARKIAAKLGGLPLALACAGACIRSHAMSFQEYLKQYEKVWTSWPNQSTHLLDYQIDRNIYTTLYVSYILLRAKYPDAANMLHLLAYFDCHDIEYNLIHAAINDESPGWLIDSVEDTHLFDYLMSMLINHSFVYAHPKPRSYSMHEHIHNWTLLALNKPLNSSSYAFALNSIEKSVPRSTASLDLLRSDNASLVFHAAWLSHPHFHEMYKDASQVRTFHQTLTESSTLLRAQRQLLGTENLRNIYLQQKSEA